MDRITLVDLVDELKEGFDQAIDAANSIVNRIAEAKGDLGDVPVRAVRDRWEKAEAAQDAAERILIALKVIRDIVDDDKVGLEAFDFSEIEEVLEEEEDEETRGDRLYHEKKDEGKL